MKFFTNIQSCKNNIPISFCMLYYMCMCYLLIKVLNHYFLSGCWNVIILNLVLGISEWGIGYPKAD